MMKCPEHNIKLERSNTKYGYRYDCPIEGCTVMCWGGETSTPADQETRDARIEAHKLFDEIPESRASRYKWLKETMGLSGKKAHIGMFSKDQCEKLIEIIRRDYP